MCVPWPLQATFSSSDKDVYLRKLNGLLVTGVYRCYVEKFAPCCRRRASRARAGKDQGKLQIVAFKREAFLSRDCMAVVEHLVHPRNKRISEGDHGRVLRADNHLVHEPVCDIAAEIKLNFEGWLLL
jgi:hypothetical protein